MRKTSVLAAVLLLGVSSFAVAQTRGGGTASPGASQYSPGHEMQNSKSNEGRGASEYSPGDRMHDKGTVGSSSRSTKGASEMSPGDRMNDKRGR